MSILIARLRITQLGLKNLLAHPKCGLSSSASQSPLSMLRKRTGLAYNLCREALNKHDNDLAKAEAWLTAESLRHGWQKATKLQSRSAREGLIGLVVNETHSTATILEVNCETDFVSRNSIFQDFVDHLTKLVATTPKFNHQQQATSNDNETIIKTKKFLIPERELSVFDEEIYPVINKLGERIRLSRAAIIQSQGPNIGLYGGVHAGSEAKSKSDPHSVMIGKFASVVGLELLSSTARVEDQMYEQIGRRLCKHIIGYSPAYIELPRAIREHLIQSAREEEEEKAKRTSAPPNVNVNDESEDYDSDAEEKSALSSTSADDWPSIMDQRLIMDDTTTVRQYCQEKNIRIVDINRFECGGDTQ